MRYCNMSITQVLGGCEQRLNFGKVKLKPLGNLLKTAPVQDFEVALGGFGGIYERLPVDLHQGDKLLRVAIVEGERKLVGVNGPDAVPAKSLFRNKFLFSRVE